MTSSLSSKPPRDAGVPPEADSPLQMSVHGLPVPHDAHRTRAGRLKMLLVLAVCAAPVVASYFTYYVIRPSGGDLNYGTIIDAPRPLPPDARMALADAGGNAVSTQSLKGQWLLVAVAGGDCDRQCEKHLYWQRQIRESLGKDKDKVDRVWLIHDGRPVRDALRPAVRDATVLQVDAQSLGRWLEPAPGRRLQDHVYLVDPHGDWMMRFPVQADPRKVQRDLSRLIRAAASWDQAGRP